MRRCRIATTISMIPALLIGTADPASSQSSRTETEGVGILIDISQSMRFSGDWQNDIRETIRDMLFGGRFDSTRWRTDGIFVPDGDVFLTAMQAGQPLYELDQPIVVVGFGEAANNPPFFAHIRDGRFSDLNDGSAFFSSSFPRQFTDDWTFLNLAKAVARNTFAEQYGIERWNLVLVSDFKPDPNYRGRLSDAADTFENRYPTTVREQTLVTFAYANDPKLKMHILRVHHTGVAGGTTTPPDPDPPPSEPPRIVLESPADGSKVSRIDRDHPLQFRWTRGDFDYYRFELRDRQNQRIRSDSTTRSVLTLTSGLPPGQYRWKVLGRSEVWRVYSPEQSFQVSRGFPWVLLLLPLAAGAYYGYLKWQEIRKQREADATI